MSDKIPTTFEMDGLFTQEDIDNRHYVMRNCLDCKQWWKADKRKGQGQVCTYCQSGAYDMKTQCSIRTWNPKAKKVTKWNEKKGGK